MTDSITLNSGSGGDSLAADEISGLKHPREKIQFGEDGSATDVSQSNPLPVADFGVLVALGLVTGYSSGEVYGRNTDVDTGTEDVWQAGGSFVAPTVARVHDIASGDAADDLGSTGAEYVRVTGIDDSGDLVSELVELNGTSNVATSNSYQHIHLLEITQAGSGGTNAGLITATAQTDATVTCSILAGKGESASSVFLVPTDYTLLLEHPWGVLGASASSGEAIFEFWYQVSTQPWRSFLAFGAQVNGAGGFARPGPPRAFAAGTWLRVSAAAAVDDCDVSAGFSYKLVSTPS